jgi:predicted ester cyclase
MKTQSEIARIAAPLARVAASEDLGRAEVLLAAEQVIREIELSFHLDSHDVARIDESRIYTRVPGYDRVGAGFAWLIDGRILMALTDRYLALVIRMYNGEDPFEIVDEIQQGRSQMASSDQLRTFSRDLPQILQGITDTFPRRQLLGEEAQVVTALRWAYHHAGVVLDWPTIGKTTRFTEAERDYRRRLRHQAREVARAEGDFTDPLVTVTRRRKRPRPVTPA